MRRSNFKFFMQELFPRWARYNKLPRIELVDSFDTDEGMPEAAAFFQPAGNVITILKKYDCVAVRVHEYGHWFNMRIYDTLELIWEFIWWGLSVRSIFVKELSP